VGKRSHGKAEEAKNLPLLMLMHRCAYVATASTAFMEDLYEKLATAIEVSKRGFAYLHVYSPCTSGWRFPSQANIEVARKAVETGFVALWDYTPQAGLRFTRPIDSLRPVSEYLEALGKYRHLDGAQLAHIQTQLEKDLGLLQELAARGAQADARALAS
jgi:phenylglyoxylate dehydrogenase beta subunit